MDETGLSPEAKDMQKGKSDGEQEWSGDRGINAGNRGQIRSHADK